MKGKHAAKKPGKKAQGQVVKTELGLEIRMKPAHRIAEEVARFREQSDDFTTKASGRLQDLAKQMKLDGLTTLIAKAPGGSAYRFELKNLGEKVKITRPKEQVEA